MTIDSMTNDLKFRQEFCHYLFCEILAENEIFTLHFLQKLGFGNDKKGEF